MDVLSYILSFYSVIGILVAGGLFFSKENKANLFLAIFIFIFSIDQLYFLYECGSLIRTHPNLYMSSFPLTLLFGPALLLHIKYLHREFNIWSFNTLMHATPFIILLCFTIYALSFPALERIEIFGLNKYYSIIKPINYFKVAHLCLYAIIMIIFIRKYSENRTSKTKHYFIVLVSVFFLTAVLQACFTAAILLSKYFIIYYVTVSTLILFVAYVLYFHRDILKRINKKYSKSSLKQNDKKRIFNKIESYLSDTNNIINQKLNLEILAHHIGEKKQHISQTISEVYKSSFNDLINKKRVVYSKALLVDPKFDHLKILAIAMESGFKNKTTFSRAFTKYNRTTPSEFRKTR